MSPEVYPLNEHAMDGRPTFTVGVTWFDGSHNQMRQSHNERYVLGWALVKSGQFFICFKIMLWIEIFIGGGTK